MRNVIDTNFIKVSQDQIEIIITALNIDQLIEFTEADIYKKIKNEDGYQRPINKIHIKELMNYIKNEQYSILPTSMVMAADKDTVIINDNSFSFEGQLRIVDGQHRIEAIRRIIEELKEEKIFNEYEGEEIDKQLNSILTWKFPVNIMLLNRKDKWDRYVEIRSFVDINKKGKTVTTDLADNNLEKIRKDLNELPQKQAIHQISLSVAKRLLDDKESVWFECMKVGDGEDINKIIGIGQFSKSIISISREVLYKRYGKLKTYSNDQINDITKELYYILKKYWEFICKKWSKAFEYNKGNFRVNFDFCIQKGIGVFPLHKLLTINFIKDNELNIALNSAINILSENKSNVLAEDWAVGSTFSSYSSSSGYNKIYKMLIGEVEK